MTLRAPELHVLLPLGWVLAGALLVLPFMVQPTVAGEAPTPNPEMLAAVALYRAEGAEAALPEFEALLEHYRATGEQEAEAVAARFVGECYWRLGQLDRSRHYLNAALDLARHAGRQDLEGRALNVLGLLEWDSGNYEAALRLLGQANALARELQDARLAASTLNNRGLVKDELGDYRGSLEDYEMALLLFEEENDRRGQGDALGNIGGVHLLLGRYPQALEHYRLSLAVSEELQSKLSMAIDHGNMALSLLGLGRTGEALEHFERALELSRQAGMAQEEAYWQRGMGNALIQQGEYDLGLVHHRAALAALESSGARGLLAAAQHDLGVLMLTLGDLVTAENLLRQADSVARDMGQEQLVTENLLVLGDLQYRLQRYDKAERLYREGLNRATDAGEEQLMAEGLLRLSWADKASGRYASAADNARQAGVAGGGIGAEPLVAEAWLAFAEAMRSQGLHDRAIGAYEASEAALADPGDPDLQWRIHYGRALSLEQLEDIETAVVELEKSVAVIESVRAGLAEERFRAGWVEDKYGVYTELVRLQLELGRTWPAFASAERLRARSFLDQLERRPAGSKGSPEREAGLRERIRQLQKALAAEQRRAPPEHRQAALALFSAELKQAEREFQAYLDDRSEIPGRQEFVLLPELEQLQEYLGDADALLEYIVAEEALFVFVMRRDTLVAVSSPLNRQELSARIDLVRELTGQPGADSWRKPAASLASLLLAPLQRGGMLDGVRHLRVVPHGALNYLPFAMLPMDESGERLLVDAFSLSYLPAASILATEPGPDLPNRSLLALAPERTQLQFAPREAASVAAMFEPDAQLLIGKYATESALKSVAGDFRMLHFATHGVFNQQNPLLSGLELEPDAHNDGLLEVHEILGLSLQAELVTLSACQTGLGSGWFADIPAGDDFVGMTRAFLSAGSRNVLATLWEVDDRSTVDLMEGFYRRIGESGAPFNQAEALAGAQRQLHRSQEFHHPFYWAPFVLVGQHGKATGKG